MGQLRLLGGSGAPYIESNGARNPVIPQQSINPGVFDRPSSIAPASTGAQGGKFGLSELSSASSSALANPFNPQLSPIPWIIGALVLGYVGLHFLHFRQGREG